MKRSIHPKLHQIKWLLSLVSLTTIVLLHVSGHWPCSGGLTMCVVQCSVQSLVVARTVRKCRSPSRQGRGASTCTCTCTCTCISPSHVATDNIPEIGLKLSEHTKHSKPQREDTAYQPLPVFGRASRRQRYGPLPTADESERALEDTLRRKA